MGFINQLITGGHHPVGDQLLPRITMVLFAAWVNHTIRVEPKCVHLVAVFPFNCGIFYRYSTNYVHVVPWKSLSKQKHNQHPTPLEIPHGLTGGGLVCDGHCRGCTHLVGGFKHEFYFPFHIWKIILPIDELIFFRMVKTTNQSLLLFVSITLLEMFETTDIFWVWFKTINQSWIIHECHWDNAIPYYTLKISPKNISRLGWNILVGGLEHCLCFHILGISSSQLTNSIIFHRGRYTTNQYTWDSECPWYLGSNS